MRVFKVLVLTVVLLLGATVLLPGLSVAADSPGDQMHVGLESIDATTKDGDFEDTIKLIVNTLLFFVGALSVLMIIYGGFKYVTSAGESSAVSSAKNTILYAVVGLVISLAAFGIASFIIDTLDSGGSAKDAGSGAAKGAIDGANKDSNGSNSPVNTGSGAPR